MSFEARELEYAIIELRDPMTSDGLSARLTTLFLEKLEQKDERFLGFLQNHFERYINCEIMGHIKTIDSSNRPYYAYVDLVEHLAKNDKLESLRTLFNCGLRGGFQLEELWRIAINRDNVELFKLLDDQVHESFNIRKHYFSEEYRRRYTPTPKIAEYLLKSSTELNFLTHHYHILRAASDQKNDVILYLILQHTSPEYIQTCITEYRNTSFRNVAIKLEAYMQGATLHQLCIATVYCRKVYIPHWFPKVLLEFTME